MRKNNENEKDIFDSGGGTRAVVDGVGAFSAFVLSKDFVTDVFKLAIFSDIGLKWDRVY